jgi:hypothetical protein
MSFFLLLFLQSLPVHAQKAGSGAWLNLDYTYSDITYKEAQASESGNMAGIRGDLGIGLTQVMGLSIGGQYMEGNLNYTGQTLTGSNVQVVTKDYFSSTYGLVHLFYNSMDLSGGIAQRVWFDNLVGSYRRRETYNYYPVALTMYRQAFYVKAELDMRFAGKNKTNMTDLSAAERPVDFTQSSGSGYGVEVGLLIPAVKIFTTHAYLSYHRWDVGDSDMQNDNVHNLVQPKNNTVTIEGGIGVAF